MKIVVQILIALFTALLYYNPAAGTQFQVTVSWTYENPPSDLAGFHLYLNGTQVQDLNVPSARSWTGPLDFDDGNNTVEIAPYDAAGQEGQKAGTTVDPPPASVTNVTATFQ